MHYYNDNQYHLSKNKGESKMFQRYSKQREVVYNVLCDTKTHPTVDWVHEEAKKVLPEIGIATVYRNLRELVKHGMAKVVLTLDNKEHFDADMTQHPHFICKSCGCVLDVATKGCTDIAQEGFVVDSCDTTFFGTCPACH